MKEITSVIILISIIKLSSYGIWNVKKEKNILGAIGVGILDIALVFQLATIIIKILK